jgi:multiple sugar transport system permease protein
MVVPAILVVLGINALPLAYGTVLSFFRWNLTQANRPPEFVGLGNFISLFTKTPAFIEAALHTFVFTAGAVAIETIFGLGIALLLNQRLRGTRAATALLLIPLALAPTVVGLLFTTLLSQSFGPINYWLGLIGIKGPLWLADPSWSIPTVILVDVWQSTPFMALLLLAGLRSLPTEPSDAASVDGASPWQKLVYITLPLLRPILAVAIILRAIDAFKTFDLVYLLTFGGPGTSSQVLSLYGYLVGLQFFDIGKAAAISFVMVQVLILFAILLYRRAREQL